MFVFVSRRKRRAGKEREALESLSVKKNQKRDNENSGTIQGNKDIELNKKRRGEKPYPPLLQSPVEEEKDFGGGLAVRGGRNRAGAAKKMDAAEREEEKRDRRVNARNGILTEVNSLFPFIGNSTAMIKRRNTIMFYTKQLTGIVRNPIFFVFKLKIRIHEI
ncbi:hypothetical protein ACLB2K_059803 [Fragaria x ananassa]